jgi:2-polyprenyl-3-methyl-5-hydroxy-6-metoxy-1,4-benzoquinol methylase
MSDDDFLGPIGNASEKYSDANPVTRRLLERFLVRLDGALLELEPTALLDVGCGEGVVTERFAALLSHASVLGVDADEVALSADWMRRSRDNLAFQVASGYALPFAEDSYDVVCAIEVLEHVKRPSDVLEEMARVARRALIVSVPREPIWRISHLLAGRNIRSLGDTPGHINHWSSAAFCRLVARYGLVERVWKPFPWTAVVLDVRR